MKTSVISNFLYPQQFLLLTLLKTIVKLSSFKKFIHGTDFHIFTDGDLGFVGAAEACYFKQKHRLAWERRHGPVGTGMKDNRPPGFTAKSDSE